MTPTPTPVPEPLRADGSCANCGKTGGHTFTCWWAMRYSTGPAPSTPGEGTGEQRCVHCGQSPDDPGASMCQTWMAGVSW